MKMVLMISADLENITELEPRKGTDDPNFAYYFKMKCGACGELSQKETCLILSETTPMPNSRGTANLVQKCKFCDREGTVTMEPGHGRPLLLNVSMKANYAPLMKFDCRGLEPVEFSFGRGWKARSTAGTIFKDIDLSGGEYAEYCEKGNLPVMISNLRSKFVGTK
ncbi:hypothetical protein GIB67_010254 [Kingdonia uniflora]|uniref:CXXC motif containing zinc binding protein n=1 Tax=Kingdonia uniflora TaxID=39325 RepID=A0A7J7NB56_9MAGN|nr:hypothetical protein GIB67_010254 [Kingdonia uniflora]